MFMDIIGLAETQKAYVLSMHAQILASKMGGSGSGVEMQGFVDLYMHFQK